jgi:inositol-phosphate phosphatase/L-galactose 1-phosphate phosphatase/histidinol-phosphatase
MTAGADAALVALAERLADAARPIVMGYFESGVTAEAKADDSPVTAADRQAESAMRAILAAECPDHGILGEEHGRHNTDAEYVWVLDPIDGTVGFATGKPLFGTLIALCRNGAPILGIIDAPAVNERWIGVKGQPTTHNGAAVATRRCAELKDAWLYATTPDMFEGASAHAFQRLSDLIRRRAFGADCYAYGLLASGRVDLVVEADLQPYDYCALVPVIEGAGGVITDWSGGALTLSSDGRVCAAGDRALHPAALDCLAD